ncbi:hypothetical protein N802_17940 [Knoellia sinensis KCTC 19936]|uniref:Uncharacterized protein n=1 Tax=Knoellia sinensis KCTC 19936 TaxID=1385520 RepID=A0A0A0J4E6_9MICO|nr:hypothetical protein [Knoellia sinensis]KGN32245.1 hypothetical protein N802_17940 [Knoellia sinensis KCTC 19936]
MAKTLGLRTSKATDLTSGTLCVVLGFAAFLLSRGRDGFDKGLFQGATVALMVLGAYLLGSAMWARRETPDPDSEHERPGDDDLWLPSRDDR